MRRTFKAIGERPAIRFGMIWLLLSVAGAAWAIATPLGASPDEPAHIIKAAAVARGDLLGEPTDEPAVRKVTVPRGIAESVDWPCYAFDGTAEASCLVSISDDWSDATARTSAGLYNPTFYALTGWPSLIVQDASAAVMGMRLVNALLTSLFLATAVFALLLLAPSRIVVAAVAAAITPMVLFLNASVNPNGLEIATGAAMLASLLLLVRGDVTRRWPWLVVVAVSAVILAQTRGLSPLWLGLFGFTAIIAAGPVRLRDLFRSAGVWIAIGAMIVGVLAAGGWIFRTNTLGSMGVFPGAGQVTAPRAFIEMLVGRTLDPGYIGVFGWLDTPAAPLAYVTWSFLALLVLLAGIAIARGRSLVALLFALLTFVFVPPIVQAASVASSGYIWQGRYALVAYVGVMVVAGVVAADVRAVRVEASPRASRRPEIVLVALVSFAQAFALLHATKRYAVGVDADWVTFLRHAEWTPPLGIFLWPVLVGLAFVALFAILLAHVRIEEDTATDERARASIN